MTLTLFSNDCPQCEVLKKKLRMTGLEFGIKTDFDELIDQGIKAVPILKVTRPDKEPLYLTFIEAVSFINIELS